MQIDISDQIYTDPVLYTRNLRCLSARVLGLQRFLEMERCSYRLHETPDGLVFRDRTGRPVLPEAEPAYSRQRVDAFLSSPTQLTTLVRLENVSSDDPAYWHEHLGAVKEFADDAFWKRPIAPEHALTLAIVDPPSTDGVLRLINAFPVLDTLLIFILDVDLFMASLQVTDWAEVFSLCDRRDIGVSFHVLPPGNEGAAKMVNQLHRAARMMPDNIVLYLHGDSSRYLDLGRTVARDFRSAALGVGFFRDEIIMLESTTDNILERNRPLLKPQFVHNGTALVVGSGPSLDQYFDTVERLSHQCAVIACGTAVEPLLARGIRVDACVLLERGTALRPIYAAMAERVDLKSVPLVASSTVHPDLEQHFARGLYFFRPGLNVAIGFGWGSEHILHNCDPTVSNTGTALALFLGFRRLVLFGIDVGSVDQSRHHSAQSAYYTDEDLKKTGLALPYEVEASFGGPAYTSLVFDWTRYKLQQLLTVQTNAIVLNLSDGVRIGSAPPLKGRMGGFLEQVFPLADAGAEALVMEGEPYDKDKYNYDPEDLDHFIRNVRRAFGRLSWSRRRETLKSLNALLWVQLPTHPFQSILRGTLSQMVWSVMGTLARMSADERAEYEPLLRHALVAGLDDMHKELGDLIRHGTRVVPQDDPRRK